jgi:hypothetical protein
MHAGAAEARKACKFIATDSRLGRRTNVPMASGRVAGADRGPTGPKTEAPLGLLGQGMHVRIGARQHVPVDEAITWRELGTVLTAVNHFEIDLPKKAVAR